MILRKARRSMSIGLKTLVSHITLVVVVLTLVSVLSYILIMQYVRETRVDDLAQKAERIAESVHTLSDGELRPTRRLVDLYQNLTDAHMFMLDAGTQSLRRWQRPNEPAEGTDAEAEYQWVEISGGIDPQFIQRILGGESVSTIRYFEFIPGEVLFAGVPVRDPAGEVVGGVILAQPVEQLHTLTRTMRLMLLAVVVGSLLLAVLLAMQLTHILVKPLTRITRAARRMTDDIYAERISPLPNDEIGDLGRAMNSMSARLMDVIKNLRKERDKLGLVISGIREGLIAVDAKRRIVHHNTTILELLELERVEDLRTSQEETLMAFWEMVVRCLGKGEHGHMEWVNRSGRALTADASTLTDEFGEALGTVCLVRDTSEAVRMEQLRRDYVANISHELRTPLTGIRGMVEPLIDGCMDTEEERQDSYRVILKETIRLEKLVGEMLDMSRLQDGRVSLELERLELPGILEAAVRGMRGIAEQSGVALEIETDGTALICVGNEDRIAQVLVILIDNALSFTPPGGRVTVFARDAGDRVAVGVRDTGCGIEPRDLPLIWERFYKADRSRMRTTGTGLGLSIAKLVVELMGGEIGVQSEPGKGAEFTFTLKK